MMSRLPWFNIYLLVSVLVGLTACQSPSKNSKKKEDKDIATVRLHMEVNDDGSGRSQPVPIFRAQPANVTVENDPFLSEAYLREASIVETQDGLFSIRLVFDEHGKRALDLASASYRGQRVAIFCQFSETKSRWLAAPRLTTHITNGVLMFTPDATREEAEAIVQGLSKVAAKIQKREL
jgi:hypothetical protein